MADYPRIEVVDMHTGGEPVRIVRSGYREILGGTILEKRRYALQHLDHLRRFLMFEPRGHADMYGAILVEPSAPDADLGVLFMHNEGYSTMCGHAVIALGRYAVDHSLVSGRQFVLECPCGPVRVEVGEDGKVSFVSVPGFLLARDVVVDGRRCDVAYGGAFYALADAGQWGLHPRRSPVKELVEAASGFSRAVRASMEVVHPEHEELGFLYGSILTDGVEDPSQISANICVFANDEVDRSPTGSGVTARTAARYAKGLVRLGKTARFESITGAVFEGTPIEETSVGEYPAVRVRVSGSAHYSGEATFSLEEGDEIGKGFLIQ